MNFYKHHIGDYAQATAHLSFIEDAAYSRLLRKYYADEHAIVADKAKAARLVGARTKEEKQAVSDVLDEFFYLADDGWTHKRCEQEIAEYREKDEERAQKAENEAERVRRHRERRKQLFEILRAHKIVPRFDTKTSELERMCNALDTRTDMTCNELDTAYQNPRTKNQEPIKSIAQQTVFETPKSDPQPPPDAHAASQVENQPPNPYAEMAIALRNQGVECTSMHPLVVQWVDAKVSINQALEAVALVRIDKPAPEKIAAKYLDYKIQKIVNPQQVTSVVQPQKPRDTCTHSDGRGTCGMPHAKPDPRQGGAMRCQHHTEISPPNTPESSQAAREAMGKVRVLLGSVNARGGPNKQEFTINKTAGVAS